MASLCAASIRMQPLLFTPVGGNPQRPVILAQPWRPGLSRPCPRGSPPPPPPCHPSPPEGHGQGAAVPCTSIGPGSHLTAAWVSGWGGDRFRSSETWCDSSHTTECGVTALCPRASYLPTLSLISLQIYLKSSWEDKRKCYVMRESFPRQVDRESRGPQGERSEDHNSRRYLFIGQLPYRSHIRNRHSRRY